MMAAMSDFGASPPPAPMRKVFVSGCYDVLHAGHVEFFRAAKALGDHLTVCFAVRMRVRCIVSSYLTREKVSSMGSNRGHNREQMMTI